MKIETRWIEETLKQFPTLFEGGWRCNYGCGIGWKPIIDDMCAKLVAVGGPDLRIVQIKEKFGQLRVYTDGGGKEVHAITDNAEALADNTCEACGKPGAMTKEFRWIKTLCPECLERRKIEDADQLL